MCVINTMRFLKQDIILSKADISIKLYRHVPFQLPSLICIELYPKQNAGHTTKLRKLLWTIVVMVYDRLKRKAIIIKSSEVSLIFAYLNYNY